MTSPVLVLHAHPDDEAIFTGAAVRLLADRGLRVVLVTATDGGQGVPRLPLRAGVDHVQVHRVGARVAAGLGLTGYEATVDPVVLRDGPRHVLAQAAGEVLDVGLPARDITFAVRADDGLLDTKMRAMAAHASQIGPEYLDGTAEGYRHEWFVRRGAAGPVDAALAGHAVAAPTVVAAGVGRARPLAGVAS